MLNYFAFHALKKLRVTFHFRLVALFIFQKQDALTKISEESSELFPFTVWLMAIFERERTKAAFCNGKCTSQTQEYI